MDKPEAGLPLAARAAALAPTDTRALGTLSRLQTATGRYQDALATAELAVATAPDHEWPHRLRGWALWMLGRREAATDAMAEAVRIDPNLEALWRLAWFASLVGRGQEAFTAGQRAVELAPTDRRAWFGLGWATWTTKQWDLSEAALLEARKLSPEASQTHNNLGALYVKLGRHHEALVCFNRALELDARSPYAYQNSAYCLRALGRWQEADGFDTRGTVNRLHKAEQAIQENRSASAHTDRGEALYDLFRIAEADHEFDNALQLARTPEETFRPLGFVASTKLLLGDDAAARAAADRMLANYPDAIHAVNIASSIGWLTADADLARRASAVAAASGLDPAGVAECLGQAALAAGDTQAAKAHLLQAIDLGRDLGNCCPRAALGATYYLSGQAEKATSEILDAARIRPNCETLIAMQERLSIPVGALLPNEPAARLQKAITLKDSIRGEILDEAGLTTTPGAPDHGPG